MAQPEGIDTQEVGLFVALGTFVVIGMVFYSQYLFYAVENENAFDKSVAAVAQVKTAIAAEQSEKLTTYKWRDKEAQRVSVPIERAMELVLSEQSAAQASVDAVVPGVK